MKECFSFVKDFWILDVTTILWNVSDLLWSELYGKCKKFGCYLFFERCVKLGFAKLLSSYDMKRHFCCQNPYNILPHVVINTNLTNKLWAPSTFLACACASKTSLGLQISLVCSPTSLHLPPKHRCFEIWTFFSLELSLLSTFQSWSLGDIQRIFHITLWWRWCSSVVQNLRILVSPSLTFWRREKLLLTSSDKAKTSKSHLFHTDVYCVQECAALVFWDWHNVFFFKTWT